MYYFLGGRWGEASQELTAQKELMEGKGKEGKGRGGEGRAGKAENSSTRPSGKCPSRLSRVPGAQRGLAPST